MMRYGLIGEKLGHSFSKIIHEKLADYTYDLIPLSLEELDTFLRKKEFSAINVTIPYKETVIPYLDEIDPKAAKMGAVNTVVQRNGKLYGYNTDYFGFRYMLEHNDIQIAGKKVLVLGRGGASKAVLAVLEDMGAAEVLTVYYKHAADAITYETCYTLHTDAQVIINTTPVGMYPKAGQTSIDLSHFSKLEAVADIVYNPLRTRLVLEAKEKGCKAIGGLEMLVGQAKYAVEIFLDKPLPEDSIAAVYKELSAERTNLVLIGMSGCGKTTLGKQAAEKLGKTFVDTDAEIVKRIKMPIADYFAAYGEDAFRNIESEVVREVSAQNNLVISTGGGVIKNSENIQWLKGNGTIFWIQRDPELLQSGNGRPLAPDQEAVHKLYKERLPLYTAAAEIVVQNNENIEKASQRICTAFSQLS
ncbi:shikimate kinase [Anaerotignum sp.]|uniref:shikimate kinase n=1 Tax=Anaerotignum sp. TaxID=2039241 RepID=UPI003735C345